MDPILFGIIGVLFILIAFVLAEFNTPITTNSESYQILNIVGSAFLTYYAYLLMSIPFIALNAAWFIVAFYKLVRVIYRH